MWFEMERGKIGDCPEWRSVKPYIGLFRNYWRFHAPIDEITLKSFIVLFLRQERYFPILTRPLVDTGDFYASFP